MFDIALGIFLFLSPIFFLPKQIGNINALQFYQFNVLGSFGYNYLQLQFFQYGTVILFLIAMFSQPRRKLNDNNTAILFFLFCLSVYWHPIGIKMFWNILCGFLLYYLVVVYTKNYKKILWIVSVVALLNTMFALLQSAGIHLIYKPTGRIDGLMCLSTHLGIYQSVALPIFYSIHPLLVIIPMVGIWLSKSITAIFIMFLFVGYFFRKKLLQFGILPLISYLTIVSLFLYKHWGLIIDKVHIRLMVWQPVFETIRAKWMFGNGLREFYFNSPKGLFENQCSIYFQLLSYIGILVFIPLIFLPNRLRGGNKILAMSIIIFLLSGIEKSFMDYPRLAGTFIVLFGFLNISRGEKNGIA